MTVTSPAPTDTARAGPSRLRRARWVLGPAIGVALVVTARLAGTAIQAHGGRLRVGQTFPMAGSWRPGVSPWLAIPVAAAAIALLAMPRLVRALRWRWVVAVSAPVSAGWAVALALGYGPSGLTDPLSSPNEYPHDVPSVRHLSDLLTGFTGHIVDPANGQVWAPHVAGHPPGALGLFVLLDRIGLAGLGWAAALCIAAGSLAAPAVLATVRLLAGEPVARRAALLVPVAPAALYVATTADALFAAVAAAGLCALAYACRRRGPRGDLLAALAGLALGACLFLSYGLGLLVIPACAIGLAHRRFRPLLVGGAVVLAMLLAAKLAGFDWLTGLRLAAERTREGPLGVHGPVAWQSRPGWYFAFADVAALAVCVGPVTLAGLGMLRRNWFALLPVAMLAAVAGAVLSDLSRGEVERIWLPFAVWLLPCAALVPTRRDRPLLAVQLGWAVLVTAMVHTWW